MLAEEAEPQPPQRVGAVQHHLHQAAGMGAGVERQRQLHDVLEIAGQHRLTLAVRQPVGVQRDRGAAADGEQAESSPGRQQRPGRCRAGGAGGGIAGEHIDDAPEQHRLGELRPGQQQVGAGQDPAQPRLLAEQLQDARVEAKQGHAGGPAERSVQAGILSRERPRRYSARAGDLPPLPDRRPRAAPGRSIHGLSPVR